jgi:predicted small secreted protein
MKKASFKSLLAAVALLVVMSTLSSCNRGYGCPNNVSVSQKAVQMVKTAFQAFAKL